MVRTEFPFAVETIDPLWIILADGTRIAATLWRPRTDAKVPVVVEMVPYRRRDGTVRDSVMYSILKGEWRDVKRHLELRLSRHQE